MKYISKVNYRVKNKFENFSYNKTKIITSISTLPSVIKLRYLKILINQNI